MLVVVKFIHSFIRSLLIGPFRETTCGLWFAFSRLKATEELHLVADYPVCLLRLNGLGIAASFKSSAAPY